VSSFLCFNKSLNEYIYIRQIVAFYDTLDVGFFIAVVVLEMRCDEIFNAVYEPIRITGICFPLVNAVMAFPTEITANLVIAISPMMKIKPCFFSLT